MPKMLIMTLFGNFFEKKFMTHYDFYGADDDVDVALIEFHHRLWSLWLLWWCQYLSRDCC